jgi:FkbM family methyltransferase
MLRAWIKWSISLFGHYVTISQPLGGLIGGFRSFSEYWGALGLIPPAHEVAFLKRYAGTKGVMIDAGANLGCMAVTMAKSRPDLKVHAFEPSPDTAAILRRNFITNGMNVNHIHQQALGNTHSLQPFADDSTAASMNHLIGGHATFSGRVVQVQVTTIDLFLRSIGDPEVSFLKVDVEGYEPMVMKGAFELLSSRRCQAGLLELSPSNLACAGYTVSDLINSVECHGYRLHFINSDGNPGVAVNSENAKGTWLTNIAMIRDRQSN